jgi:NAD(P)H-flavin reductase
MEERTVFDLFEEWLTYCNVSSTAEAVQHIQSVQTRTSYCIARQIHVSLSYQDHTFAIHDVAVRDVRQGHGTRFIQELRTHGKVQIHGPFTHAGRALVEKHSLVIACNTRVSAP